jgi:hypothetical protein
MKFSTMEHDYGRLDLRTLLELYMDEAKEFSSALSKGASWDILKEKRMHIKLLSEYINRKYKEQYYSERRRDLPPHGD